MEHLVSLCGVASYFPMPKINDGEGKTLATLVRFHLKPGIRLVAERQDYPLGAAHQTAREFRPLQIGWMDFGTGIVICLKEGSDPVRRKEKQREDRKSVV
jgi:hypothetical protein